MSILIIGPAEEKRIAEAIEAARKNPVPLSVLQGVSNETTSSPTTLLLVDRKPGVDFVRRRYEPQQVILGTFRCALSFEQHPEGLLRHISISTRKGKLPHFEVIKMVLEAFGFSGIPLQRPGNVWNEEFEPGWFAINIVELEP